MLLISKKDRDAPEVRIPGCSCAVVDWPEFVERELTRMNERFRKVLEKRDKREGREE